MGRKAVAISHDMIVRAINAVQKAGVEIKTVRIEPDGAIVINADGPDAPAKKVEKYVKPYL